MLEESQKWFRVSLCIFGDQLKPLKVSEVLGLKADRVGVKGVRRIGKDKRSYAPYETNIWIYRCGRPSDMNFEEQILSIFGDLGSNLTMLKSLLDCPGVGGELLCGFSSGNGQGGDTISFSILKRIADLGLDLSLDLYPPDVSDMGEFEEVE